MKALSREVLAGFEWSDRQKEHFFVFGFNTRNTLTYCDIATIGTLDASLVHPREVMRMAIVHGVSSIALMHNHPSGDPSASREDISVTERLLKAGTLLGIDILDHIVAGSDANLEGDCESIRETHSYLFEDHAPYQRMVLQEPPLPQDEELEAFKRLPINFAAASLGYKIVKAKSSKHSAVMVRDGHKIVCSTARHDGHGVFFATDNTVSGSIIDLAKHVTGGNLGVARKTLRPLLQAGGLPQDFETAGWKLDPSKTDFLSVLARFSNFDPVTSRHAFLSGTRRLPEQLISSERFSGRVFHDPAKGTAIFPHYGSPDGSRDRCLTGYTIKGENGLTMFSKGGKKGLWPSNATPEDHTLVICESAIDALSYAALKHGSEALARYVSTGGQLNPEQPALIQSAIEKLPADGEVTIAVDNDAGGDQLTRTLTKIFNDANRSDLALSVDVPPTRGHDWNRELSNR